MSKGLNQAELDFFRSALARDSRVFPNATIMGWLRARNASVATRVEQVPLDRLRRWRFDPGTGNIVHESGRFFSIQGIHVETNWGPVASWEQPIINQPEIGFLGILAKKIDGILHLLLQAKIEPGNLNTVQLSPTLQATKSNYTRVHQGSRPLFLEWFNGERRACVLLDQLQSEQGARFLRKRNRNIIVEVDEAELASVPADFVWMTLGQLKQLMQHDNLVNMDARSVIAGIPFGSYGTTALGYFSALGGGTRVNEALMNSGLNDEVFANDFRRIISWITELKTRYELLVRDVPLHEVRGWKNDGMSIHHVDHKYFSVIGVNVAIGNREVVEWDQPMIKPAQEGLVAFVVKPIHGVHHFLVQAKVEAGNLDVLELAPTVQCLTGNYRIGHNEYTIPFLNEVLSAPPERVWYSALQSEEGGRFYKEQNRNMIVEVGDEFPETVPDMYCWMTLQQLLTFTMFNNYLNIAARSLIAAVAF
jgi:oxidase EvaA